MRNERFIVHFTAKDPLPDSTYGTTPPGTWAVSVADASFKLEQGRRVYITERDDDANIVRTFTTWTKGDPRYSYDKAAVIKEAAKVDCELDPEDIALVDGVCHLDGVIWFEWLETLFGDH